MTSDATPAPSAAPGTAAPSPVPRLPRWLPWLLAALLFANFAAGIFPFSPVEGDEQGIINGLHEMARGDTAYYSLRYDYEFQSGTYQFVLLGHRLMRVDVGSLYFILSAATAIGFILLSARLISALATIPYAWSLALVLLCQEPMTAAYYANTSTVGGFWTMLGLCLLLPDAPRLGDRWRWLVAGLCFALGAWCRIDSLMLPPAALVLFWRHARFSVACLRTALVAAISLVALTLLLLSVGLSWPRVLHHFTELTNTVGVLGYGYTAANLYLETSLVLTACAVGGLALAAWRREWLIPALFASVALPGLYVHGNYLASPKYLYFLAPVLALCAAMLLRAVLPHLLRKTSLLRRLAAALLVLALAAEYLTSLRTSTAEFRRFTPAPTCATLASFHLGAKPATWVVGPGEILPDADAFRVRTGYGFAPWVWHREKQSALAELARLRTTIAHTRGRYAILTTTYLSNQCALGELRAQGYVRTEVVLYPGNPDHHADLWQRGPTRCWLVWVNHSPDDAEAFASYAHRFANLPEYFFNDLGALAAHRLFGPAARDWKLLSPREDGLLAWYERRR